MIKSGNLPVDRDGYHEVSYSMVHDAKIGSGNHGIRLGISENNGHPRLRTFYLLGFDIQDGKAIVAKVLDKNGVESILELIDASD